MKLFLEIVSCIALNSWGDLLFFHLLRNLLLQKVGVLEDIRNFITRNRGYRCATIPGHVWGVWALTTTKSSVSKSSACYPRSTLKSGKLGESMGFSLTCFHPSKGFLAFRAESSCKPWVPLTHVDFIMLKNSLTRVIMFLIDILFFLYKLKHTRSLRCMV
jgi:hypothetical protein